MKNALIAVAATLGMALATPAVRAEGEHAHFDIAPYFDGVKLLTGGMDHGGDHLAPPISVYGYEFGEDPADPFNPTDPGVNQDATGNLPAGATLRYNILSSLLFWDGAGDVEFAPVTGDARIDLWMGSSKRTLTGSSGPQAGSLIQTVLSGGIVHKHFVTGLYADDLADNVPGSSGFVAPADGFYAYSLELTLTQGISTHVSDPFWVVFNNDMDEELHEAAMTAMVPEPSSIALLSIGGLGLLARRRNR